MKGTLSYERRLKSEKEASGCNILTLICKCIDIGVYEINRCL